MAVFCHFFLAFHSVMCYNKLITTKEVFFIAIIKQFDKRSGVDSVSGATKSSNAIKKAFYYAYKSAKK